MQLCHLHLGMKHKTGLCWGRFCGWAEKIVKRGGCSVDNRLILLTPAHAVILLVKQFYIQSSIIQNQSSTFHRLPCSHFSNLDSWDLTVLSLILNCPKN
jgi:hypothetical protein